MEIVNKTDITNLPAPYASQASEFLDALHELMEKSIRARTARLIPAENYLHLRHGTQWATALDSPGESQELKAHTVDITVQLERIVNHDLKLLVEFLEQAVTGMHRELQTTIFTSISEGAEKVGNTVVNTGSPAQSYLEMLRTIEFGVDADGRVSEPQLHQSPSSARAMIEDINRQPPAFLEEIERVKALKRTEALEREVTRLAKYRST